VQWWCAAQGVAWSWSWKPYPGVWLFIGVLALVCTRALAGAYGVDSGDGGLDREGFSRRARAAFAAAGLVLLWVALDWPVGALGSGYLASLHMVQFLLIAVAAPPLLLLGVPERCWRRWLTARAPRAVVRVLGHPIVALTVFAGMTALTHWPVVVDALMGDQLGSFVLDMLWLGAGLVFWWPVAVALPERPWLREPFKFGYLIAATIVNTGVFAYLTFSGLPLYATYELAPPVGLLSTRDDQLLAGLLMKVGGAVVLWTAISLLFFRWFRRSEREDDAVTAPVVTGLVLLLSLGMAGCREDSTTVAGPRVAVAIVSEPVTGDRAALYLRIDNRAGDTDTLVAVDVEGVASAGLHRTELVDGVLRMRAAVGGLELPAEGELRMAPGGIHVMLEGLDRPLSAGARVPLVLHFRKAGALADTARVEPLDRLEEALGREPQG
jgi:putative membrane protein